MLNASYTYSSAFATGLACAPVKHEAHAACTLQGETQQLVQRLLRRARAHVLVQCKHVDPIQQRTLALGLSSRFVLLQRLRTWAPKNRKLSKHRNQEQCQKSYDIKCRKTFYLQLFEWSQVKATSSQAHGIVLLRCTAPCESASKYAGWKWNHRFRVPSLYTTIAKQQFCSNDNRTYQTQNRGIICCL